MGDFVNKILHKKIKFIIDKYDISLYICNIKTTTTINREVKNEIHWHWN